MPIFLSVILFRTSCFWTSILAYLAFGEKIVAIEIIAMIISFACIVTMTLSNSMDNKTATVTTQADAQSDYKMILGCSLLFLGSWVFATSCVLNRALIRGHELHDFMTPGFDAVR